MSTATPSILVTAVGALIGQGIVRSLLAQGQCPRIIGLDRSSNRYGASIVNAYHCKPCKETEDGYLPWLADLIERENISLILPGIEEDVFFFHDHREAMRSWPAKVVLNSPEAIVAGRDKWLLHEQMLACGLPAIPTVPLMEWQDFEASLGPPPYIVKARRGSGSRGQMILPSEEEWKRHQHEFGAQHMVQRVVGSDDEEYTVATFGLGGGAATGFFVMKRRLWNGGTWLAEVVEGDSELEELCASLNRLLKPEGPTNYQFRREKDTWYLLEINPRLSASTAIRAGFGFNEAQMCIDYYVRQQVPATGPLRRGFCQRYVTEHFDYT
jgi:carbamoyl-phosphate synthase large subunit